MGQYKSIPADVQLSTEETTVENPYSHVSGISYGALIGPGLKPHPQQPYSFPSIPLPDRVDLRQTSCAPYFEPFSQGNVYSCTSDALAAAFMCSQRRQKQDQGSWIKPSTLFNYYFARAEMGPQMISKNSGSSLQAAMIAMRQGVSDSKTWPQSESWSEKPNTRAQKNSLHHTVTVGLPLDQNLQNLKRCLSHGYPFVFVFAVTPVMDAWFKNRQQQEESQFIMAEGELVPRNVHMGHAVLALGYDDDYFNGVFIVRNSWGPEWGMNGHFFIPYTVVTNPDISAEFFVIERVCSDLKNRCNSNCPSFYSHTACQ